MTSLPATARLPTGEVVARPRWRSLPAVLEGDQLPSPRPVPRRCATTRRGVRRGWWPSRARADHGRHVVDPALSRRTAARPCRRNGRRPHPTSDQPARRWRRSARRRCPVRQTGLQQRRASGAASARRSEWPPRRIGGLCISVSPGIQSLARSSVRRCHERRRPGVEIAGHLVSRLVVDRVPVCGHVLDRRRRRRSRAPVSRR